MEYFGTDIYFYILKFVLYFENEISINEIINYKLVCKEWLAIIDSSYLNKSIFIRPIYIKENVWNKLILKYKINEENYIYNYALFNRLKLEHHLYLLNAEIFEYFKDPYYFPHLTAMIEKLELPHISSILFNRYLPLIIMVFDPHLHKFLTWLDLLIEVYFTELKKKIFKAGKDHDIYWKIITTTISSLPNNYDFVNKYHMNLDWYDAKLHSSIDQHFILFHPGLWDNWDEIIWNQLCVSNTFSEEFIEEVIINDLYKKRKIHITFAYIFKNQNLSEEFIKKIFVNSDDNRINNETNWSIILASNYVSDSFKEIHKNKIPKPILSASYLRTIRTIKKSDIKFL